MTIVYKGGEIGSLTPIDSNIFESTNSDNFDENFCRAAIIGFNSTSYWEAEQISALTGNAWLHMDARWEGPYGYGGTENSLVVWYDNSGVARIRISHGSTNSSNFKVQYDVGSGWVTAGTITLDIVTSVQTIDLGCVINSASGSITLIVAGTERFTATGLDLSAITSLKKFRGFGVTILGVNNWKAFFSQLIAADESTVGMRLMTCPATGDGASTAWTGDRTAIDEAIYNDGDFIASSTNGQRELFTITPVGSLTGYIVRSVAVTARAKRGSTGPANLQLTVRTGGANFDSASKALSLAYGAHMNIWEDDPNTGVDWLAADAAAIQIGVEANT